MITCWKWQSVYRLHFFTSDETYLLISMDGILKYFERSWDTYIPYSILYLYHHVCSRSLSNDSLSQVISENKEILLRDEVSDSAVSSSDSLCSHERSPSVTVVRPGGDSPSLSPPGDQDSPSLPPISPLFKMFESDVCGTPAKGPRFKLITEGDLQVGKYGRRWVTRFSGESTVSERVSVSTRLSNKTNVNVKNPSF